MSQNHFHPVFLNSDEVKSIYSVLVSSGHNDLALKIAKKAKRTETDKKYTNAVGHLDGGTFDIDNHPVVSKGEGGAYVMVWKWVYLSEIQRCEL